MKMSMKVVGVGGLLAATSIAVAQRSPEPRQGGADGFVAQMMVFDADKDGKVSESELTDARLKRLFDRADADHDKVVTEAELRALAAKEQADDESRPRGPGGPDGPGGFGGPGGPRMGPPGRVGEVLPGMFRQRLNLSASQEKELGELQQEVDARLAKILNDDQKAQLKQMSERGPGGPPGGRGGRPGGGPPPPRD